MNFYDFTAFKINGKEIKMEEYRGEIVLVVNTASSCGLTYQLKDLEELYREHKGRGFVVLGFPCNQFANQEKNDNKEISDFCQLNYGVTFPMFEKIKVNGTDAHPLYKYLKKETKGILSDEIKWNFTKFLIDREGKVIKRYSPLTSIKSIKKDIEKI